MDDVGPVLGVRRERKLSREQNGLATGTSPGWHACSLQELVFKYRTLLL